MQHFRTILHPTDFSAAADAAFGAGLFVVSSVGGRLILLHCLPAPVTAIGGTQALPPLPDEAGRREAQDKLQAACGLPALAAECKVTEGDAANEIVRLAQETPCDLIVMGTHGRSGVGRLLLGSVAEAVLRKASCPVLTVKAPAAVVS